MLLLVGALLTPVALAAHWARETITSTDGYVAAVDELAADPAVREALVDHLTTVTLEQVDADALGVTLRLALEPLVRDLLTRVMDSDAFAAAWNQANRNVHATVVALLTEDDAGALNLTADGQVSLNLGPVLDLARAELVARGITVADSIPQVDVSVPVVSSQQLVQARASYTVLDTVAGWLPWVVALVVGAAVALARSRAAVLAWEAGSIVVLTALVSLAVVVARSSVIESLTGSRLRTEVTSSVVTILADSALAALRVGYAVGAVLAVAAVGVWVVGRFRPAASTSGPRQYS